METGEVSRQARPQGFGECAPITADKLASAIASAQASARTALGMPTPPSPGRIIVLMLKFIFYEKATKFCEISIVDLTVITRVKVHVF